MVCIRARSRDTGFIQYFDEFDYLHFVRISDAKVIASRFPATVLNVRNDCFASKSLNEGKTGLNTRDAYAGGRQKGQLPPFALIYGGAGMARISLHAELLPSLLPSEGAFSDVVDGFFQNIFSGASPRPPYYHGVAGKQIFKALSF